MRHIKLVLTDEDIKLLLVSIDAQVKAFEGLLQEGKLPPDRADMSKRFISTYTSLWHKFNWALNPKQVKE